MDNGSKCELFPRKMNSQELLEMIENLDPTEKEKLLRQLTPGVTVIFGGTNLVSHGAALQINVGQQEDICKALENIPPEALGEFVKTLGVYIARRSG